MTGTDLCVNKPHCVPVIFEPPCIYNSADGNLKKKKSLGRLERISEGD
jgi:hypothetical protein